jgi:hypothetical protein
LPLSREHSGRGLRHHGEDLIESVLNNIGVENISGREKWFFGSLTAVSVVAIAIVAVAILLVLPVSSTQEPAAAPAPIISVPERISLDTGSETTCTIAAGGTGTATAAPDIA